MKKTLSIILAILMIVTTIPMAFAAEDTPDFSDANELTSVYDSLYINGKRINDATLPEGKYKLSGNISTNYYYFSTDGEVVIDLNGYTWNMNGGKIIAGDSLSVYDTSTDKTGKITTNDDESGAIVLSKVFNLYGGTIENTSSNKTAYALLSGERTININLYGGKVISNGYAVYFRNDYNNTRLMLGDVVLESGEGYAQIYHGLTNETMLAFIDVTDYTGESLEVFSFLPLVGKVKILEGVKSAKEAEKYKINIDAWVGNSKGFVEKIEYDEATGCINAFIDESSFIQQPSVDNNLTLDFNNPAATFQWYEVEEKNIGVYTVDNESKSLFTYDFKAGDILKVSTDSEMEYVAIGDGHYYHVFLFYGMKTQSIKFDNDETVTINPLFMSTENPIELEFSVITKETVLDGETGKTLQKPECNKNYWCKVTVDDFIYSSETVVRTHITTQVDAKAPTCTEIGWEAYEYCTNCDYTTYKEIPATGEHIDADGDTMCDNGGEQLTCEDCGRPVHDDSFVQNLICWILMLINLIKTMF